ncbi:ABC transporter ATP-binding protein [Mesomycoplasma moatsii]|uniref:ABC transporter ATP-binding protein n=1 Tax=Mesomycoplasma moatsii TaxID=171287 RepID=UPI0003B3975F
MNNINKRPIEINNLTKDYGFGRGIFDINIYVNKGEVLGFLGPNGAGKTTTIRHLLGFSAPHKGSCFINNLSCFENAKIIQNDLGYLPGEIALPENLTPLEFIEYMADLRKIKDMTYTNYLINLFELNLENKKIKLKRMALGEKRKLAIITAFMHDPQTLVLDEPTSGLDPIGQVTFVNFIKEEKRRGKSILLSSHLFQEVEAVCDRISIIKDGKIINECNIESIKYRDKKTFVLNFLDLFSFSNFKKEPFVISYENKDLLQIDISIEDSQTNDLIKTLTNYQLKSFKEKKFTLEDYFMHFYDKNTKDYK